MRCTQVSLSVHESDRPYVQRNDALVFAQYTQQNLQLIDRVFAGNSEFHQFTQLINSLLGLIVFLNEKSFDNSTAGLELDKLVAKGWPQIEMSGERCSTLGYLINHLRNAVAHGRMTYSSDSHDISQVVIKVEDYKPKQSAPYWSAIFKAAQLRDLCFQFVRLLQNTIG